ncbi:MAG: aminotransferase class I/II-fold pyridoxal phosphate-dependent enzyme [Actinomycetota bacterium]
MGTKRRRTGKDVACSGFAARMESHLTQLEAESQLRDLRSSHSTSLCSNDYLGLAADPRLKAALLQAVENSSRTGATGSRLVSGHDPLWDALEEQFAAFAGTQSALFFSSGFAANTGLLSALLGPADLVFSDAFNHASIIDGIRLSRAQKVIYPHLDLNALEHALRRNRNRGGARVVVTESIFSMEGDRAPLLEIFELAGRYGAEVIVDEAHATGVCGPNGRGLVAELGLEPLAVIHTCGKALASMGAFVCGSTTLRRFLINRARSFIFSTALPPYCAGQIGAAVRLAWSMDKERSHLAALSAALKNSLQEPGFSCGSSSSHIVPLVLGSNEDALSFSAALEQRGFRVRAIRPPAVPTGTARLRISLTAALAMRDIHDFSDALASISALARHA